jgi:hypothetical protein
MTKQTVEPGDRVLIPAIVECLGHDDNHVIVRVAGIPVQVSTASCEERKDCP